MKNLIIVILLTFISVNALAQINVVSMNKPLGFLNPALQNYEMEKGVISVSGLINPFVQDENSMNYLAVAEFKLNDDFRLGVNGTKVENRLSSYSAYKFYASYRLEMDAGNYLIIGGDVGTYSDLVKTNEFNKVLSPNKFVLQDSIASGIDLGLGIAYSYSGFTLGMGFSKLNKPEVIDFPRGIWEEDSNGNFNLQDTTVVSTEVSGKYGLQSNINILYEWEANENLKLSHSLQFGNPDFGGVDYVGFQNIAEINQRHSLGLGVFHNGNTGYVPRFHRPPA